MLVLSSGRRRGMSIGGEETGTLPDISTFGCWEGHALRYTGGGLKFGLFLAHRKD